MKSRKMKGKHAPVSLQYDDPKKLHKHQKKQMVSRIQIQKTKQVELFSHLPQYERESSLSLQFGFCAEELHPAILRLGLKLSEGVITGANARCVAMLTAFKQFITDYKTPPDKSLSRDLDVALKPMIRFLIDCRPQSVSMGNAIKYLKFQIAKIPPTTSEEKAKKELVGKIDHFIQTRIGFADKVISRSAVGKIQNNDTILVYARSHVVEMVIKAAWDAGKRFRVIVVGARPKTEGRDLLERLINYGIKCSFILLNAISYVMNQVSVVFLGAYTVFSNGTVVSRVGSAVLSMMAHTYKVPLLVCCETYKFCERVQLDSICSNELGDPDDLIPLGRDTGDILSDWRDKKHLKILNLTYDLTPIEFVSMVVTELGLIPATSVPVIIREYWKDVA